MRVPERSVRAPGIAWFAGVEATDLVEVVDVRAEPERLAAPGWWAVVGDFEGRVRAWRFATEMATEGRRLCLHEGGCDGIGHAFAGAGEGETAI